VPSEEVGLRCLSDVEGSVLGDGVISNGVPNALAKVANWSKEQ
jgi:hypothetical protein